MPEIEIKSWITGGVLFKTTAVDLRAAVVEAARSGAYLSGADLSGADLSRADLSGADLSRADLSRADLSGADLSRADLSGADLSRAYLSGADLSGADLSGADLKPDTRIETGETWREYLTQTVPALLTAGGRALAEIATKDIWDCHTWQNCPMAEAFSTHDVSGVPILLRPRAEQFITYFDAKLIPLEALAPEGIA